jgi:DNA-binding transcriptional ArsR family regulator
MTRWLRKPRRGDCFSDASGRDRYRRLPGTIRTDHGRIRDAADGSGKLSAAELAERLGVGAPAISGAVKYLVQVRLVERGREPGSRRDFCRIHEHTWSHYISRSDPVLVQVQVGAAEGADLLGPASPAGQRLDETRRFFEFLRAEIDQSMAKWRRLQADEREPG